MGVSATAPANFSGEVIHLSAFNQVTTVTVDRWLRTDGTFEDLSSLIDSGHKESLPPAF
jgi:hypothetical protein